MTDFKHIEEQIALLHERGCAFCNYDCSDIADTMQAMLSVVRAVQPVAAIADQNNVGVKLLYDALDKLKGNDGE